MDKGKTSFSVLSFCAFKGWLWSFAIWSVRNSLFGIGQIPKLIVKGVLTNLIKTTTRFHRNSFSGSCGNCPFYFQFFYLFYFLFLNLEQKTIPMWWQLNNDQNMVPHYPHGARYLFNLIFSSFGADPTAINRFKVFNVCTFQLPWPWSPLFLFFFGWLLLFSLYNW